MTWNFPEIEIVREDVLLIGTHKYKNRFSDHLAEIDKTTSN